MDGSYLTLRTSWVYTTRRDSFVTKVLQWSRQQTTLRMVTDQVSGPTWARQLAEITAHLLAKSGEQPAAWISERRGVYHLAGSGYCSWHELAREVVALAGIRVPVEPIASAALGRPAKRPAFSALASERPIPRLPHWAEGVAEVVDRLIPLG